MSGPHTASSPFGVGSTMRRRHPAPYPVAAPARQPRVLADVRDKQQPRSVGQSTPVTPRVPTTAGSVPFSCSLHQPNHRVDETGVGSGVRARTIISPSSRAVAVASTSRSHSTWRWSETKPVGRRDRPDTALGQVSEVIVDVRLQPRRTRRPGADCQARSKAAPEPRTARRETRRFALLAGRRPSWRWRPQRPAPSAP